MDVGALSLLISEKGFDATMAKVAALDAAAARVGAKQTELKVTSPTALAVEAALARVGATATRVAGAPVSIRLALTGLPETLGGLGGLEGAKAKASGTPVTTTFAPPNLTPVTTALAGLEVQKLRASAPVATTILPPNVAPAMAALAGLDVAKVAAGAPVVVTIPPPLVAPAIAALNVLDTEKQQAAQPVSVTVLVPQVGPAITALGALEQEKAQASAPVVTTVAPPAVGPTIAALGTLDTAKADVAAPLAIPVVAPVVAPAMAALGALGAAKATVAQPVSVTVGTPNIGPVVAALGALDAAKVAASAPVTTPVVAPVVGPAITALGALETAKAVAGQPLTVPVIAPNVTPAVAALSALDTAKATVAQPVAVPVTAPNVGPAVAGLGALEGAKTKAAGPVVVTVPAPAIGPTVAALDGIQAAKAMAGTPVTTTVLPPNVGPVVAAFEGIAGAKATAGTPVAISVLPPDIAPATTALSGLETAKAKAGAPVTVPVAVPGVETATTQIHAFVDAAGRLRDTGGRFLAMSAEVQAAFAGIDRAKLKAGTPVVLTVQAPNVGPAVAGLAGLEAEKARVSAPVVVTVTPPNVAPAIAGLSALAEAQALQVTRAAALSAALATVASGTGTVAERAQILRAALDQDAASTENLSTAARQLAIADREGTTVIRLRTQATNELIAAQNELARAQSTGARVRAAPLPGAVVNPIPTGPQLGPATPEREAFAQRAAATKAAYEAEAAAARQAAVAHVGYAGAVNTAGASTERLSPKLRTAANGLTAVAFAATATNGSFQSMALGAGLAASSIASMAGGSVALWASGIGAAIVVGVAFIGILDRIAGSAKAADIALRHVGNLDRITSTQAAFARASGEVERLTNKIGEMDERVKDAAATGGALGAGLLARALFERLKVQRELERAQEILGATQVRAAEVAREQTIAVAAAQREAAVSASRDQLQITTALIDRQESLNAQAYALGLVRLDDYFAARLEIADKRSKATIAALAAERKALSVAPVGEKPDEAVGRRARLASIDAELEAEQIRRRTASQSMMAEREAAERALVQRLNGFERQRMEAQGQTHAARLQQIAQEAEEYQRALAVKPDVSPETKAALVTALRSALTAQENFNEAQRQAGREFEAMGIEREKIQRQVESGQLTEFQGQQAIAAAERARIPDLQKIAAEMERFARELKNEDLINAAKQLTGELGALGRLSLSPLAARLKSIMDELSLEAGAGDQWAKSILAELQAAVARNGGTVTIGIVAQAEWALNIKRQIEEQFALLTILLKPKAIVAEGLLGALQNLNQQLAGFALNVGNSIGTALAAGFSSAFTRGSGKSFFEAAGLSILSGIGNILVQLGSAMLTYGLLMAAGLPLLLATPFAGQALSAPAAIAAGTGLIALGAGMGAIAANNTGTRTGGSAGSGGRSASRAEIPTQRVILDPDRRLREAREVAPRVSVNESARASTSMQQYVYAPVILGNADPQAQRWVVDAFDKGKRRNLGR